MSLISLDEKWEVVDSGKTFYVCTSMIWGIWIQFTQIALLSKIP